MTATLTGIALASITPSLTTTFAPTATTCLENRLTMLANRGFQIWNNMINPVAGTSFTNCYPSQYVTSYLLAAGSVTQPAFAPLVCPQNWATLGPFTSNYIACCPSGYSLANPTVSVKSDRPAYGGTCYSDLTSGTSYLITQYGSLSVTQTTSFPITVTNAQAYAYPIDGFAYGNAELASDKSTVASVKATTTGSSSASAATNTATPNPTYLVSVNAEPTFIPTSLNLRVNDTIVFQVTSGNHSVVQSTFEDPCKALAGGFNSGFLVSTGNTSAAAPQASFKVLTTVPQFFFSSGPSDCASGMVFVANPLGSQTSETFRAKAISMYGSSSKSHGVAIGVGVGVSLAAVLGLIAAFFLWRRRRSAHVRKQVPGSETDAYQAYSPEDGSQVEPKSMAVSEADADVHKVGDGEIPPPLPPPNFELHNQQAAYEMGGGQGLGQHYEMEGSQHFGKR